MLPEPIKLDPKDRVLLCVLQTQETGSKDAAQGRPTEWELQQGKINVEIIVIIIVIATKPW